MSRRKNRRRRLQASQPPVEIHAQKEVQAEPDLPAPERNDEQGSGFWFVQIPIALVRDSELSHTSLRVYAALASYANSEKIAWPGQARLAKDIGVSDRTIRLRLKELEAAGHIVIKRRGRRKTNVYYLPGLPDRKRTSGANNGDRNQAPVTKGVSGIQPVEVSGIQAGTNNNQQNKTQHRKEQHQLSAAGAAAAINRTVEFKKFLHLYTTEIGASSPAIEQKLAAMAEIFPVEWFENAIAEAVLYNATHKLAYAIKVMQRWRDEKSQNEAIAASVDLESTPAPSSPASPPANPVIYRRLCDLFDDTETSFSPAEVWLGAMERLRLQMDKATFRWLREVQVVDLDGDAFVVSTQGGYAADLMQHRMQPALARTISALAGRQMTVRIVAIDRQHAPAA